MQSIVAIVRFFKAAKRMWDNLVSECSLAVKAAQKGEERVNGIQQRLQHFQVHRIGATHQDLKRKKCLTTKT